jgi:hypothetical protein
VTWINPHKFHWLHRLDLYALKNIKRPPGGRCALVQAQTRFGRAALTEERWNLKNAVTLSSESNPERSTLRASSALRRGQGLPPLSRTPFSASGVPPLLRFGHVSLDEAEHFPAQSSCQRRYAPMVFGIIPECRSASLRIERSASPESPHEVEGERTFLISRITTTANPSSSNHRAFSGKWAGMGF